MSKTIKFITNGSSSLLGSFGPGDVARNLPDDLADHLVNEAKCAKFVDVLTIMPGTKGATIERPRRARKPAEPAAELPPQDPDRKGGENNPLTMADAEADLAGTPRPE